MNSKAQMEITSDQFVYQGKKFFTHGKMYKGQEAFARAVISDQDSLEYKRLFIDAIQAGKPSLYNEHIFKALSLCFKESRIRHLSLFSVWLFYVFENEETSKLEGLQDYTKYEDFVSAFNVSDYAQALRNALLCEGLKKLLILNYNFECLLTHIRRLCFLEASPQDLEKIEPFLTALSIQCFFNEYVFYISEPEQERVEELLEKEGQLTRLELLLLSCYMPLYKLKDKEAAVQSLNNSEIIRVHITEPEQERLLYSKIMSFGSISDSISQTVQAQYEDNPYPRWAYCGGGNRLEGRKALSADKRILVAGCGTGQQAIVIGENFPHAEIIAIDLSRSSLSYAQRKANEYGLSHIQFMQGDILDVGSLGKKFDYIACSGVLHHMKEPVKGFRALQYVLAPAGIMRIALYSEIARSNIVKVQEWIKTQNIPATEIGICQFKHDYMNGICDHLFDGKRPWFNLSAASDMRDFFFHVQEYRYTCLDLKQILESLNLELLLFAPEEFSARQKYINNYPDDPDALNLEYWHEFEQKYPNTFLGMYKFYVASKDTHEPGQLPRWLR